MYQSLLTIAVRSETVVPHKEAMFSIKTGLPWKTERSRTSPFSLAAWKLWRVLPADIEEKRRLEVETTEESINNAQTILKQSSMNIELFWRMQQHHFFLLSAVKWLADIFEVFVRYIPRQSIFSKKYTSTWSSFYQTDQGYRRHKLTIPEMLQIQECHRKECQWNAWSFLSKLSLQVFSLFWNVLILLNFRCRTRTH